MHGLKILLAWPPLVPHSRQLTLRRTCTHVTQGNRAAQKTRESTPMKIRKQTKTKRPLCAQLLNAKSGRLESTTYVTALACPLWSTLDTIPCKHIVTAVVTHASLLQRPEMIVGRFFIRCPWQLPGRWFFDPPRDQRARSSSEPALEASRFCPLMPCSLTAP